MRRIRLIAWFEIIFCPRERETLYETVDRIIILSDALSNLLETINNASNVRCWSFSGNGVKNARQIFKRVSNIL